MNIKFCFIISIFSTAMFCSDHSNDPANQASSYWGYGWSWTTATLGSLPLISNYFSSVDDESCPPKETSAQTPRPQEDALIVPHVVSGELVQAVARRLQIMLAHVAPEKIDRASFANETIAH